MPRLPFPLEAFPVAGAKAAVVVLPGGGYTVLADHEAAPVARWLNSIGLGAAVAMYRRGDDQSRHPVPLHDALTAVAALRQEYDAVGVLGFSAGGHLAATVATATDEERDVAGVGDAGKADFAVLCYPVIRLHDAEGGSHPGSRKNLLGDRTGDDALAASLNADARVTADTPPTFVFHTAFDPGVPVGPALAYANACSAHKVPFAVHVTDDSHQPKHGVGLADDTSPTPGVLNATWTAHAAAWMRHHGWAK